MKLDLHELNTFCVALPSRWPRMKERLERHAISCTKWPAITPETLSGRYGRFESRLNPAQKACAASHAHLWHHIWASELPYAFILEDDIIFHEGWKETLHELPDDPEWDAFFPECFRASLPARRVAANAGAVVYGGLHHLQEGHRVAAAELHDPSRSGLHDLAPPTQGAQL